MENILNFPLSIKLCVDTILLASKARPGSGFTLKAMFLHQTPGLILALLADISIVVFGYSNWLFLQLLL
jgi:hypothetical protein